MTNLQAVRHEQDEQAGNVVRNGDVMPHMVYSADQLHDWIIRVCELRCVAPRAVDPREYRDAETLGGTVGTAGTVRIETAISASDVVTAHGAGWFAEAAVQAGLLG